jgi:hypothetical protein
LTLTSDAQWRPRLYRRGTRRDRRSQKPGVSSTSRRTSSRCQSEWNIRVHAVVCGRKLTLLPIAPFPSDRALSGIGDHYPSKMQRRLVLPSFVPHRLCPLLAATQRPRAQASSGRETLWNLSRRSHYQKCPRKNGHERSRTQIGSSSSVKPRPGSTTPPSALPQPASRVKPRSTLRIYFSSSRTLLYLFLHLPAAAARRHRHR